tara:strand:+ start:4608 stop:4898 length:291 start_codon:yes stop_codon:yes gene_type:complete
MTTTTTQTARARCECCGTELPARGRGRPRSYCPLSKCAELAKRIERARVLMAEIIDDAPSATRGRAFARMRGLLGRLDEQLDDLREDHRTHDHLAA